MTAMPLSSLRDVETTTVNEHVNLALHTIGQLSNDRTHNCVSNHIENIGMGNCYNVSHKSSSSSSA
jgi:hypothetical protein